jgi:hypothetical protein
MANEFVASGVYMRTVQLAIHNSSYARRIKELLSQDEACNVIVTEEPDLDLDGVILMEEDTFDALRQPLVQADRFVVVASRNTLGLERIWNGGVHHVVFNDDSPNTAHLAIIAALLRTAIKPENHTRYPRWPDLGDAHPLGSATPDARLTRPC